MEHRAGRLVLRQQVKQAASLARAERGLFGPVELHAAAVADRDLKPRRSFAKRLSLEITK